METSTEPPGVALTIREWCLSWIRPARRPCCTASLAGLTGQARSEVWSETRRATFTAPPETAALWDAEPILTAVERCLSSFREGWLFQVSAIYPTVQRSHTARECPVRRF